MASNALFNIRQEKKKKKKKKHMAKGQARGRWASGSNCVPCSIAYIIGEMPSRPLPVAPPRSARSCAGSWPRRGGRCRRRGGRCRRRGGRWRKRGGSWRRCGGWKRRACLHTALRAQVPPEDVCVFFFFGGGGGKKGSKYLWDLGETTQAVRVVTGVALSHLGRFQLG